MELNFIKLFQQVYAVTANCIVQNHILKCECRDHVRNSLESLDSLLDELQCIPDGRFLTDEIWQNTTDKIRRTLSGYCDDSRDILFKCCYYKKQFSLSKSLDLHILMYITTALALEIIWPDLVARTTPIHPTKTNSEILKFIKEMMLLFCGLNHHVTEMMTFYPHHFLMIALTQNDKPEDLKDTCKNALRFLTTVEGDALVPDDRDKMGEIILSQITEPSHTEGTADVYRFQNATDQDSEDSFSSSCNSDNLSDVQVESVDHDFFYSFLSSSE